MTTSGTIRIRVNQGPPVSRALIVVHINPSPPPAETTEEFLNPSEEIWDAVKGNATKAITVTHNGAVPPVISSVEVG